MTSEDSQIAAETVDRDAGWNKYKTSYCQKYIDRDKITSTKHTGNVN